MSVHMDGERDQFLQNLLSRPLLHLQRVSFLKVQLLTNSIKDTNNSNELLMPQLIFLSYFDLELDHTVFFLCHQFPFHVVKCSLHISMLAKCSTALGAHSFSVDFPVHGHLGSLQFWLCT